MLHSKARYIRSYVALQATVLSELRRFLNYVALAKQRCTLSYVALQAALRSKLRCNLSYIAL